MVEEGESRPACSVCWGKGFKNGRWEVYLHPVFYLTPKKKGWGVGTDCIWWGGRVSTLCPFSISPGRRSPVFPCSAGQSGRRSDGTPKE